MYGCMEEDRIEDRIIKEISNFKEEYSKELESKINLLEDAYANAYDIAGLKTAKEGFIEFKEVLKKANSLSDLSNKIKEIQKLKRRFEHQIISSKGYNNENTKKAIDEVLNRLDEIVKFIETIDKEIIKTLRPIKDNVIKCPFGQAENSTKNALEFQRNAIKLFSWLFVDEMKLLKRDEIKQEQLIRDGIFEIEDNFFERRKIDRLKFTHIVIECKNYKKPSYEDLTQVYAYTLLNKIYPISDNPLCIILSRENPSDDSITLKMRDRLFEKNGDKYLLILFLSCENLSKMVELRECSGDPFIVLKDHIDDIVRKNVTKES